MEETIHPYLIGGIIASVVLLVVATLYVTNVPRKSSSGHPSGSGRAFATARNAVVTPPNKSTAQSARPQAPAVPIRKKEYKPGKALLIGRVLPYYKTFAFPSGIESCVRIIWINAGAGTAVGARYYGTVIFQPTNLASKGFRGLDNAQHTVVRDWKATFVNYMRFHRYAEGDLTDIPPTDATHPPMATLAEGSLLTSEHLTQIFAGQERIFILGAIRFSDSLGQHEVHICKYVSIVVGSNPTATESGYKMRFVNCREYNEQIDLPAESAEAIGAQ